jgi:hypothetical protein
LECYLEIAIPESNFGGVSWEGAGSFFLWLEVVEVKG